MNILVTYATRYGSTTDIAAAIADALISEGHRVDLILVDTNPDPSCYDAIILGAPLYLGKWLRSMAEYIAGHKGVFATTPHAVFTVGYTLREAGEKEVAAARLAELEFQQYISPVYRGFFAGKLTNKGLNQADNAIITMVGLPDGDFRNLAKAAVWAGEALKYLFPVI